MTTETFNPDYYVGPRPFEYKDRAMFFGRDKESRDLLSLAIAHRALLIYAQSGAGKTSLINTRLKPDLEAEEFHVLGIVRMQYPLKDETLAGVGNVFIYKTLLNLTADADDDESLKAMTLSEYLTRLKVEKDKDDYQKPRVVIFDQFEEIFTLHADRWQDRNGFFSQIREAMEQPGKGRYSDLPPLRVIFVMREDYIANLDQYTSSLPENLRTRYRLERLREEAAIQAVKGPLTKSRVTFAEGVAEELVNELLEVRVETGTGESREIKGEYVEPVQLQLVCQNLLQNLPPDVNKIRREDIEKFGDVDKALSRFYSEAVQSAVEKAFLNEGTFRDWIETVLITPTGTRGTVHRGRESTAGISNQALNILEARHVVRAEFRAGAHWYELAHDRFIDPIRASNKAFRAKAAGRVDVEDDGQKALRFLASGEQARELKKHEEAMQAYQSAREYFGRIDDPKVVNVLTGMGELCLDMGNFDDALKNFEEALQVNKIVDDQWGILTAKSAIARTYRLMGDFKKAERLFNEITVSVAQSPDKGMDLLFERLKSMDDAFVSRQGFFDQARADFVESEGRRQKIFSEGLVLLTPLTRPAYSDMMALILATMAKLAYMRFEDSEREYLELENALNQGGFNLIKTFDSQDTHAFLAKNDRFAVLAFRGIESRNMSNFSVDLNVYTLTAKSGGVRDGYRSALDGIFEELVNVLRYQKLPLYLTGHSLGAPLAILALSSLESEMGTRDQIAACYTFGSPRLGIRSLESAIQSPVYRVVNATDIVTTVPLFTMGFIHIGDVRYLGRKVGEPRRGIPSLQRFFLFIAAVFRFFNPLITDHSIENYRRKLEVIALSRNRGMSFGA